MTNIARVAGLLYVVIDVFGMLFGHPDPSHPAPAWLPPGSLLEGFAGRMEVVGGL